MWVGSIWIWPCCVWEGRRSFHIISSVSGGSSAMISSLPPGAKSFSTITASCRSWKDTNLWQKVIQKQRTHKVLQDYMMTCKNIPKICCILLNDKSWIILVRLTVNHWLSSDAILWLYSSLFPMISCSLPTCASTWTAKFNELTACCSQQGGLGHFSPGNRFSSFIDLSLASCKAKGWQHTGKKGSWCR